LFHSVCYLQEQDNEDLVEIGLNLMEDGLRGYCNTYKFCWSVDQILKISNGIGPVKLLSSISNISRLCRLLIWLGIAPGRICATIYTHYFSKQKIMWLNESDIQVKQMSKKSSKTLN
jgi:hypothetical protein